MKFYVRQYQRTEENFLKYINEIMQGACIDVTLSIMEHKFKQVGIKIPQFISIKILAELLVQHNKLTGETKFTDAIFIPLTMEDWLNGFYDFWGIEINGMVEGFMLFTYVVDKNIGKANFMPKNLFTQAYIKPKYRGQRIMSRAVITAIKHYKFTELSSESPNKGGIAMLKNVKNRIEIKITKLTYHTDDTGKLVHVQNAGMIY